MFLLVFSYFFFTSYYHHSCIFLNLKFVNNSRQKYLIKKKDFIGMGQQYSSHSQSNFCFSFIYYFVICVI